MRAIGHTRRTALTDPNALVEFDLPEPEVRDRDLLVEVRAVSVNPVDVKVRELLEPDGPHRVLGYDAAGVVRAAGPGVIGFAVGDEVFYAGDITRAGSNAELQAVDERIVGHKPATLTMPEAASLPLTSVTAWEILFDCFRVEEGGGAGESLLVIGGAGGVGSVLIQLAKALTGLTVIATASREESRAWATRMGADHVIDHRGPLTPQLRAIGGRAPRYVAALTHTEQHFDAIVELIEPRGHMTLIDDPQTLDVTKLKHKALTLSWEFMFTRPVHQTSDMDAQRRLLERVSALVDSGRLRHTATTTFDDLSLDTLRSAHELQESGRAIGKTVLGPISR